MKNFPLFYAITLNAPFQETFNTFFMTDPPARKSFAETKHSQQLLLAETNSWSLSLPPPRFSEKLVSCREKLPARRPGAYPCSREWVRVVRLYDPGQRQITSSSGNESPSTKSSKFFKGKGVTKSRKWTTSFIKNPAEGPGWAPDRNFKTNKEHPTLKSGNGKLPTEGLIR